jgi:hypothetical protein
LNIRVSSSYNEEKCTSNKSSLVNKKGNVEEFIRTYNLNTSFKYYVIKERKKTIANKLQTNNFRLSYLDQGKLRYVLFSQWSYSCMLYGT